VTVTTWLRWPAVPGDAHAPRFAYGADYNPEQWPRETWREDVELMREAGVNLVNLGIFSWAQVRPSRTERCFEWLDEVFDLLHGAGIAVDLGTGTSSPPPWLTEQHPEILPVAADGTVVSPGGRQHWRPTSPVFREHALDHVREMAERYGGHPGLAMWHVSNELGCHNVHDYSDDAAAAFRVWLREKYESLSALNAAWGTTFWSQHYSAWEQILPPRIAASPRNPTQQLDFARFSSDMLKDYFRAEAAILRAATPDVPVTTNFMVMANTKFMDYAEWAGEVDIVSNDHYVSVARPDAFEELCFSANLVRGTAGGRPWFLMEHSTSAVNWQPVNVPKAPGQLQRDSLAHVAHGSDAVSFFQWRQSVAGAEKFHSAMLPHAGVDSRVWRDVCALGQTLHRIAEVAGTGCEPAQVAVVFDWPSWWASELDSHPSDRFRYRDLAIEWYTAVQSLGVAVDVQPAEADLSAYPMVVAPALYLVDAELRARLESYVAGGGHLVTTYFSGIVDQHDHIHVGAFPGALRDLLGVRVEELAPLPPGCRVMLDDGSEATDWAEQVNVTGADVSTLLRYAEGDAAGTAAATRRTVNGGSAVYVGTKLDAPSLRTLCRRLVTLAGVMPELDESVASVVTRRVRADETRRFVFLVNHGADPQTVSGEKGTDLVTGNEITDSLSLGRYGVAVIRAD
jgi:beta-galactosidase